MAFALVPSDCIGIISVYVNASQLDWSKNKTSNQIAFIKLCSLYI